ncbi:MAG: glycoside hydrolase family 172 protein [Planctomycetota bacterium]|nr:glycoside hydrolase family 172 protein [Planctomycetota bacterium]
MQWGFVFRRRPIRSAFHAVSVLIAAGVMGFAPPVAGAADVTFDSLLEEMTDLAGLAEYPDPPFVCRQFSSYDRASTSPDDEETWFANRDAGNFLRVEEIDGRQESVMMDAEGPGAIVRIWSANAKGIIRIYLDGAKKPTLAMPMQTLLGGKPPIGLPLSGVRARGWNCYLPIPYARHCKITCDDPDGLYYQINYRTYDPSVTVEPFRSAFFEEKSRLVAAANERLANPQVTFQQSVEMPEGLEVDEEVELLSVDGPGAIREIRIRVFTVNRRAALRGCLLVAEFDGRQTVYCPVGDFFGSAPDVNAYRSWPVTVDEKGMMTARWCMPFAESATIRLVNRSDQIIALSGSIGYGDYEWTDRSMHFHAAWRQEGPIDTRPRRDFNYATIEGRGVWVGDALHVANPVVGWWGEGDEKIYIDGETFPSHFGTGTEDYYGYAWCNTALFQAPQHNQTRCDGPRNFGYTSVNRFRLLDTIPFTESLKVDMEVWHWSETTMHYAVTDYFYGRDLVHNVTPVTEPGEFLVPKVELRIFRRDNVIEAESLEVINKTTAPERKVQLMGDGSPGTWSNMKHVWCKATEPGQRVVLTGPVEKAGEYEVIVYLTHSFDYGILQFYVNGRKAGEPVDTFNTENPDRVAPPKAYSLGTHYLARVGFSLTVELVGSNENARDPGTYWGLDCIELKRVF